MLHVALLFAVSGAPGPCAEVVGPAEVVHAGLRASRDLDAARAAREAQRAARGAAVAALLPRIEVGAAFEAIDRLRADASFGAQAPYMLSGQVQAQVPVVHEAAWARLRAAAHAADAEGLRADAAQVEVAHFAAQAYVALAHADQFVRLEQARVRALTAQLDGAQRAAAAGSGARLAVHTLGAELASARLGATEARRARAQARQAILRLTRGAVDPACVAPFESLATSGAAAEAVSPGLHARASMEEGAAARRLGTSARRAYLIPRLDLYGVLQGNLLRLGLDAPEPLPPPFDDAVPNLPRGPFWQVGLRLTWSLFDGGVGLFEARRLEAEARALEARAQATRETRHEQRRVAVVSRDAAREALELSEAGVEAGAQAVRLVEAAQRRGLVPLRDVLRARADLLDLERQRLDARRALIESGLQIDALADLPPSLHLRETTP